MFVELEGYEDSNGGIKARSYLGEPSNSRNDIGGFVHNNNRTRSETRLRILQGVIIHSDKTW